MTAYLKLEGTIRNQAAKKTLEQLYPLFEKVGITRVANITGLDYLGIPSAICIRPNAKHLAVSQGKGLSWELAQVSAIMESLECFHAENLAVPSFQGSYESLKNQSPVVDPKIFNPGSFQIQNLENYNLDWMEVVDLNQIGKNFFIPQVLANLNSSENHPEYHFFSVSSNGLAAGNSREEAICHAIYEVIERDSLCRWKVQSPEQIQSSMLKLTSIDSGYNQLILEKFHEGNQIVSVWDITSALGIPSFHCVIKEKSLLRSPGVYRGTGTHLYKDIALSRALTEAAQSRLAIISGARDEIFSDEYQKNRWISYSTEEAVGSKDYKSCVQPEVIDSFSQNIAYLCKTLADQGFLQVFVADHTHHELNIPIVHVFIPGMQYSGTRT